MDRPALPACLGGVDSHLGADRVLGYAYEWARFTAWGVDTAPRRHNIDYGKLFATGGRAFLILLMMGLAVRAVLAFMGFARLGHVLRFLPLGSGLSVSALVEAWPISPSGASSPLLSGSFWERF